MLLHVGVRRLTGRVVAAGQALGDGDAEHILRIAKSLQPLAHIGAGGAGFPLKNLQILHHLDNTQAGSVHILLSRHDFQGHAAIVLPGSGKHIGGRIRYNSKIHDDISLSSVFQ